MVAIAIVLLLGMIGYTCLQTKCVCMCLAFLQITTGHLSEK